MIRIIESSNSIMIKRIQVKIIGIEGIEMKLISD